MSKYTVQDTIEENGIKILKSNLDSNFFLINDFADFVGKDKYPDIDGQLRLRNGNGTYLNKYLHYQTKSHKKTKNYKKYFLTRKIINYLLETNVPTLLFVVDTINKKSYWFFISKLIKRDFDLSSDNKGRSVDLTKNEIKNNSQQLNHKWQNFAKGDSYKEISKELDKIVDKFSVNLQSCLGILYLFRVIKKQEFPKIISDLLTIEEHESITIVKYLENANIINSTVNFFLLENEKLGIESLFLLLDSQLINFENLDKHLAPDNKKIVFEQLVKIDHPRVDDYFKNLSVGFWKYLPKFKSNDDIFINLELLEKYIYRVSDKAIQILRKIINNKKPLKMVIKNIDGWGEVEGKSHVAVLDKSIELLERLRYIRPKEVFTQLLKLSKFEENSIKEKAVMSLEKMAEYNLFVLKKIGYSPQIFLLDEIEKFGDRKLLIYFEMIATILNQIISPSFEGNEMTDYKTYTIRFGGLDASKTLKAIRKRTIEILQKLFSLSRKTSQKKKILEVLNGATLTPQNNYTEKLEELILENTNEIINFYNKIIKDANFEIIKEVEEQSYWFTKRSSKKFENIKKLQSTIAQNNDYDMFKVFVGHNHQFDVDLDWKESEAIRKQKIDAFIKLISNNNFNEWQKNILSIIKNYNQTKGHGKYQYFNIFLNQLGKEKPEIALKLIQKNETKLEDFLIHLIAGIWVSKNRGIAVNLIENFIRKGKHLSIGAYIFSYVRDIDKSLLLKIFKKAKQHKDVNALTNVIRSIVDNYPDDTKHTKLFIETIKELTKLKSCLWINSVWFQKKSIIEILSDKDSAVILNSLLLLPDVDYHAEAILKTIAKKSPLKIINFFEERISIQLNKDRDNRFDAVPFNFHELGTILQEKRAIVIPEVLKWFKKENWLFNWDGGHFLKNLFSLNDLDEELSKLLNTDKEKDTKVVLSILDTYQGQISLDSKVIQILIKKYPNHHEKLIANISATGGVVSGEYGFVNSLKNKKAAVQKWKKDKRKFIQNFIKKYEESLDNQIDFEKKRADEDLELLKLDYK